jgi:hypothetical protein
MGIVYRRTSAVLADGAVSLNAREAMVYFA